MDTFPLDHLLTQLELRGEVQPEQLTITPTQEGFGRSATHNAAVEALKTDLTSNLVLFQKLAQERGQYQNAVESKEKWLGERLEEIARRTSRAGDPELRFSNSGWLPAVAELPLKYRTKQAMPLWGDVLLEAGPWRKVSGWSDTPPFGHPSAARWRLRYDNPVPVSEIQLHGNPSELLCYRVEPASVETASGTLVTCSETGLLRPQQVVVDVTTGALEGLWFVGTLTQAGGLQGAPDGLRAGDQLTIGYQVDSYGLGLGLWEVEEDGAPVWGKTFDLVVASEQSPAWLGLPDPQLSLKTYAARTVLSSNVGPEPTTVVQFTTDEVTPLGGVIEYELLGNTAPELDSESRLEGVLDRSRVGVSTQPLGVAVEAGSPITIHQVWTPLRYQEQLTQDRFHRVQLSWTPHLSESTLWAARNGFNPNFTKQDGVLTLGDKGKLLNWVQTGNVSLQGYGISPVFDSRNNVYDEGHPIDASNECLRLDARSTPSSILTRADLGQPYGIHHYFGLRWVTPVETTATLATAGLAANEMTEVRLREDLAGNYLSLRFWLKSTDTTELHYGLWKSTAGVASQLGDVDSFTLATLDFAISTTNLSSLDAYATHMGWIYCTLSFNDEAGVYQLIISNLSDDGNDAAPWFNKATTFSHSGGHPAGQAFSVRQATGMVDVDSLAIYSNLPDLAPIRVGVTKEGRWIPPDTQGVDLELSHPQYVRVVVHPSDRKQVYTLPYAAAEVDSGTEQVTVKEWDSYTQKAGNTIFSGGTWSGSPVVIDGNQLRLVGLAWDGPVEIAYWAVRFGNSRVPVAVNRTDYLGLELQRSLRPLELNLDSEQYFPLVEYLQQDRYLYFAERHDSIDVEYETYGRFLQLQATLKRGVNPSRALRIRGGHWTLR